MTDRLNRSKIEKFFHSECGEECMKFAGKELQRSIENIHDQFADRFTDYLQDEYSLFFADRVRDGIIKEIQSLLAGDDKTLERYCLAPADWGLRCDPDGIRRKICQDNKDIITSARITELEEENARLREMLDRRYRYEQC